MGYGTWSSNSYTSYSTGLGRTVTTDGLLDSKYTAQDLYKSRSLDPILNPYGVVRECCDSDEHPNTIPVILALDVTGSMGSAAAEVAKKLNAIMTDLYERVADVEFMVMGIGDMAYDDAPVQASQYESDIRIAEQLDKVYFEAGGGGNGFESYTAAWYMGLYHTKLDCWKRGKKGIIITLGDEPLNPYLPRSGVNGVFGDNAERDVETKDLYSKVIEKFDVYHLAIDDPHSSYRYYARDIDRSWGKQLDGKHFMAVTLDNLATTIADIVANSTANDVVKPLTTLSDVVIDREDNRERNEISW